MSKCPTCAGTGHITVHDRVDYGSTTVDMPSDEWCPDCLDKGKCPKCGGEVIAYESAGDDCRLCRLCDWHDES